MKPFIPSDSDLVQKGKISGLLSRLGKLRALTVAQKESVQRKTAIRHFGQEHLELSL